MEEIELPITEKSNDITKDLDILEPIQVIIIIMKKIKNGLKIKDVKIISSNRFPNFFRMVLLSFFNG